MTTSTQTQTIKEPVKSPRRRGMEEAAQPRHGRYAGERRGGQPPGTARDKFSTPPTKDSGQNMENKALLKIRKALYKKIVRDSSNVDAVFLDEYEKVNRALEQLGIRRKSLPPEARGRPRSTEGSIGGAVEYSEPRAPASGGKAVEKKGGEGKSFEYLFAKILAGPLSPAAATDGVPASAGDLDGTSKAPRHQARGAGKSRRRRRCSPRCGPHCGHLRILQRRTQRPQRQHTAAHAQPHRRPAHRQDPRAAAGSGTETASCTPVQIPQTKRIFNPVSPILKAKETNTLLFNSIEF